MGSAARSSWRTAAFALRAGVIAFAAISAVIAIAQGSFRVSAPTCGAPTVHWIRLLPWALVGLVPMLVWLILRVLAARYELEPVASGEGPYRQSLLDRAKVHSPRSHHVVRFAFVLLALGIGYAHSREWCGLELPKSCKTAYVKHILLVPMGSIDNAKVERLAKHFKDCYGLPVEVSPPIEAPAAAFNASRQQWSAQKLMTALPACRVNDWLCEPKVVISVTDLDLYSEDESWNFALGVRDPDRKVAIVSTYRMTSYLFFNEEERATKLIAKDIALQFCQLPLSEDPHSIRYTVGGVLQLDAIDESNW